MTVSTLKKSARMDGYRAVVPPMIRRQLSLTKDDWISFQVEESGRVYIEADRSQGADPTLNAFLDLVDADMKAHPESLEPMDSALLERAQSLVDGVEVDMTSILPPDDE